METIAHNSPLPLLERLAGRHGREHQPGGHCALSDVLSLLGAPRHLMPSAPGRQPPSQIPGR
jgi:hypothetical protein